MRSPKNNAGDARTAAAASVRRPFGSFASTTKGLLRDDRGSATAEYAVATMAAVGFAGLLVVLLRGDEVRAILTDLVKRALSAAG